MILSWPILQPHPTLDYWRTLHQLVGYFKHKGARISIPQNFWSDLTSMPNEGWPLVQASPNKLAVPSLVHDYCVRLHAEYLDPAGVPHEIEFDDSLYFMNEAMIDCGVIAPDRWIINSTLAALKPIYWRKKLITWRP